MPRSTKTAKAIPVKKPKIAVAATTAQYSHPSIDYRFGVVGNFFFKAKDRDVSATELASACLKQLQMKSVLLPNRSHATPKLIVVPDNEEAAELAQLHIDRSAVCFIPFSVFLSLLMQKTQLELLRCLGFSTMEAEKFVSKVAKFCLRSPVQLHGLSLSHAFVSDGLQHMGYKMNAKCGGTATHKKKASALIGDPEYSARDSHEVQLTVLDFLALQPHSELARLHKLFNDAVETLSIAPEEKAVMKKPKKALATEEKEEKAVTKKPKKVLATKAKPKSKPKAAKIVAEEVQGKNEEDEKETVVESADDDQVQWIL